MAAAASLAWLAITAALRIWLTIANGASSGPSTRAILAISPICALSEERHARYVYVITRRIPSSCATRHRRAPVVSAFPVSRHARRIVEQARLLSERRVSTCTVSATGPIGGCTARVRRIPQLARTIPRLSGHGSEDSRKRHGFRLFPAWHKTGSVDDRCDSPPSASEIHIIGWRHRCPSRGDMSSAVFNRTRASKPRPRGRLSVSSMAESSVSPVLREARRFPRHCRHRHPASTAPSAALADVLFR